MFYAVYELSQRKQALLVAKLIANKQLLINYWCTAWNPNYSKFEQLLSPGWIPGRKVDNSDSQYASFRGNVPYLFIVMALHPLLRKLFNALYNEPKTLSLGKSKEMLDGSGSSLDSEHCNANDRMNQRITFDVGFSLLFLVALHGFSALKVLVILYTNYVLATNLRREYVPAVTWIFNIGTLFANELGQGYPYATIANTILPRASSGDGNKDNWGSYLDSYGGLIPRWEILFNVTILRLISFNFDCIWAGSRSGSSSPIEVRHASPESNEL